MQDLLGVVRKDLHTLEKELYGVINSPNPLLAEAARHLFQAGGKRLRPAFAMLAARFHNYDLKKVLPVALSLELLHMATLVHDDVVDNAGYRRGLPSVKALWGNRVSANAGDFLFAKSMLLLLDNYRNPIFIQKLSQTCVKMCEGELIQLSGVFTADLRNYLRRIKYKTALLIRNSCQLGAAAVEAPPQVMNSLGRFGYSLGMAFQITDDVLDIVADQKTLGKPVGGDLAQGIINLPIIIALANCALNKRDYFSTLVVKPHKTEAELEEAITLTMTYGGVEGALAVADQYLIKAKEALLLLPRTPARDTLFTIAEFVRARKF